MVRKMQNIQRRMKVCLKNGIYTSRDSSDIGYVDQTNSRIRLRDGRDHVWMSPFMDSNVINVSSVQDKSYEKFNTPLKGFIDNAKDIKGVKDKHSLNQPAKIGITNIKQTQHIPPKIQKILMPRNNTKLSYPTLKNMCINSTIDSSSTLIMKRRANIKLLLNIYADGEGGNQLALHKVTYDLVVSR
ncbi:uncharacterized protein LOC105663200 isoform X2 [Megachile rotundata]|uniref:uncharacterized protein LOC105663200 isoform X2 n=1 Tax=Megachile rotundata TaxID=143995 RepID=UPI003FD2CF72